jgi:hypothetical protein
VKLKLAFIALMMVAGIVNAAPLEWNLEGVTFDDGTHATGYFSYDANINVVFNWSISLTGSAPDDPFTFVNSNTNWVFYDNNSHTMQLQVDSPYGSPVFSRRLLELDYVAGMTNAGGTISIANSSNELLYGGLDSNGCPGYSCNGYSRGITAGAITSAVPEPETYAMMLAGLGLLGFMARRRMRRDAA